MPRQSLPHETTDGIYVFQPSPAVNTPPFQRVQKLLGKQDIDPYTDAVLLEIPQAELDRFQDRIRHDQLLVFTEYSTKSGPIPKGTIPPEVGTLKPNRG